MLDRNFSGCLILRFTKKMDESVYGCVTCEGRVLPLSPNSEINIIGGSLFRTGTAGAGRINPRYNIGLMRGIEEYSHFQLKEDADTAIVVISRGSGENLDSNPVQGEFYLTEEEENLLSEVTQNHTSTIVILNTGYPMDVRFASKYKVDALIWCGYPGMQGGRALVEILDGRVNPSGKLPDTWSLDYYDIPASANFYNAIDGKGVLSTDSSLFVDTVYEEDIYVGYRYYETFNKPVAYPFGYGLSYTTFYIEAEAEGLHIKVRFMPSFEGDYTFKIYGNFSDKTFNGNFTVTPACGNNLEYKGFNLFPKRENT